MSVSPIFPTKFSLEDNGQIAGTGQSEGENVSISYTLGEVSLASASNLGLVSDYDLVDVFPEESTPEEAKPTDDGNLHGDSAEVDADQSQAVESTPEEPEQDSPEFYAASAVGTASARYTPAQYALAITGGVAAGILAVYIVNKLTSR